MRKIPRFFCQIQPQKFFYFHRGLIRPLYMVSPMWSAPPLLTPLSTQIIWSINRGFRQRMLSSLLSNCSTEQFTIYIAFNGPCQYYCVADAERRAEDQSLCTPCEDTKQNLSIMQTVTWLWSTAFDCPMASIFSGKNETVEQLRIRIISANSASIYKVYKVQLVTSSALALHCCKVHAKINSTRCSAIAERPRCRVRYSFRQK